MAGDQGPRKMWAGHYVAPLSTSLGAAPEGARIIIFSRTQDLRPGLLYFGPFGALVHRRLEKSRFSAG